MKSFDVRLFCQLQRVDMDLFHLQSQKEKNPAQGREAEQTLKHIQEEIALKGEQIKQDRIQIKNQELDLARQEGQIQKLTQQLNTVKTNKEYALLVTEINRTKGDKGVLEEKMLKSLQEVEEGEKELKSTQGTMAQKEQEIKILQRRLEQEMKEIEERISQKEKERQALTQTLDPEMLSRYDRIVEHKTDHRALAEVKEEVCQGCCMSVTPQEMNVLLLGQETLQCRNCSRILYIGIGDAEVSSS